MSKQCYGEIVTVDSYNYGKRCSIYCDSSFCTYHKFQQNSKEICVKRIKEMLAENERTTGRENKTKVVTRVYDFILDNLEFVKAHEKFKNTVLKNLDDLSESPNSWSEALSYKEKILKKLEKLENEKN